ncbi:MAG TPA: alpha/beta fold hydrolase [Chryseosolibacter sp.]
MSSRVTIKEFPQAALVGTWFPPAPSVKKNAFLIGCAMGVTQKYYHHLAEYLSESGYTVLTFDYRGTGDSAPARLRGYRINLFDWADDIRYALEYLKTKNPDDEIIFLGHSIASQLFGFVDGKNLASRAIFLASSTGYWADGIGLSKWKNLFLLSVVMPFSNAVWGYTNAKFFKQGENYPKGPSLQWRRWCLHPNYFAIENLRSLKPFAEFSGPIRSYYFTDDPIANEATAKKLLAAYTNSNTVLIKKKPSDYQQASIGHTGFLSRKFRSSFWQELAS